MFKVVTHELCDDSILFCHLQLQFRHPHPRRLEFLLQGLDTSKLFSLHDHRIVRAVHRIIRLQVKSVDCQNRRIHSSTYHRLDVCHRMVQTGTNDPHQLMTCINRLGVRPLVVAPVPLLRASLHLSCVVGSQGQTLETTTSSHRPRRDEVVQGQTIKGTERTPRTLDSLVYCLGRQIGPPRIVTSASSVLDIVATLESLEALHPSIVNILGIGNEL